MPSSSRTLRLALVGDGYHYMFIARRAYRTQRLIQSKSYRVCMVIYSNLSGLCMYVCFFILTDRAISNEAYDKTQIYVHDPPDHVKRMILL